ncbi:hypothetical protein ACFE04_024079 [Oxalis oulophora]
MKTGIISLLVFLLLVHQSTSSSMNTDVVLLLSFKYSIINDPFNVLQNWNYDDQNSMTPCSWTGVNCHHNNNNTNMPRVTSLSLPNTNLVGTLPADLGLIEFLRILDLSNNSLNGSIPFSIFNSNSLRFLDLSYNRFSGDLPEIIELGNLQSLNLSDNSLTSNLPAKLSTLSKLTVVSLKRNYFSGNLLSGFVFIEFLDLSSNSINGSLPLDFGGDRIRYLNVSYNNISGEIPDQFAAKIAENATMDLSFNYLTGEIPKNAVFLNQEQSSFAGNKGLCEESPQKPCRVSPATSSLLNVTAISSPPAFAAIPETIGSNQTTAESKKQRKTRLKPKIIALIVVGDFIGVSLISLIFIYIFNSKKRKNAVENEANAVKDGAEWSPSASESKGFTRWSCLLKRTAAEENSDVEETETTSNDSDSFENNQQNHDHNNQEGDDKKGTLVTLNGGGSDSKQLELETLLKASAYILGATGSSIMYRAVLEDGSALAVRRIGESSVDRFRDFENQVRVIAKLVHPNLVSIRGFYWGVDEKLIIYDFVPNGSLANARYNSNNGVSHTHTHTSISGKVGSSPCHLPWEARLKIAKGMARGLAYLHDKKHVHANLKPSNILLGHENEPRIGDFGLEKLVTCDASYKVGSSRNFGSKRSTASRDSFHETASVGPSPSPSPSPSCIGATSPYHAPESLRSLKANPKWDVYSFGVILLELLTGKVMLVDEMGQVNGLAVEDTNRALRMADVAIRGDVEGKEEALLGIFKLGYSCASPIPQKRPSMKEALQVLDKFPTTSTLYLYGH